MAPQSSPGAGAAPIDPNESLSGSIIACVGVMLAASTIALGLRFYVRGRLLRTVSAEDWCIFTAWVSFDNQAFAPVAEPRRMRVSGGCGPTRRLHCTNTGAPSLTPLVSTGLYRCCWWFDDKRYVWLGNTNFPAIDPVLTICYRSSAGAG